MPKKTATTKTQNADRLNDATLSAILNQKHGFSVILGEYHRGNRHTISEQLLKADDHLYYRLKVVQYRFFRTQKELNQYCEDKGIVFTQY